MFELYFPEDKTEYIPAVGILIVFIILAVVVWRFFKWHHQKELTKLGELEAKIKEAQSKNDQSHS